MQLAGVVGIGEPQQGLRLDQLQYVLVEDQDSEPQGGKTSFWVFNKSQEIVVPGTASSERQTTEAVPDPTLPESSAAKQTAITDFFSPRPSTCPAQNSESSFSASTRFAKEGMASKNSSSSSELAASELIGTALAKDEKKIGAKHNMKKTETAGDEERLAGIAKMEADYQSEIRIMKLTHEQAMREMEEKLDQKDEVVKSATRLAEGAAAKLAATLAKPTDAGANSVEVYQLTKRRDGLLKEVESSRGKISDLTRSVQEIREQLATALIQRDDTRTALAAANAETKSAKVEATSAKAEATKAFDAGSQLSRLTDMANEELKRSNEKIEAILGGKGGEVIKGQIRLIDLLRAENEDFEQQLHASSLEIMNLKESEKAAADNVAKDRQLYKKELSKYKKEVLSCNTKILELEAKKLDFEKALQAGTGFVAVAILLRDREQTIADLTTRIEDIALLHQKEIKYENHVMEIQKELQCMYRTNDSLVLEVSDLKEDLEREMLNNDSLQDKVTLLQSNDLLKSHYNNICNKHTILNILTKEKLTLEKDCATLQKANAKLEQRHISEEDLRKLIYDLLHRIIRLSHALSSRGAYPFNAGYSSIVDRAFVVADIEAEDVYADATTDGYKNEFDTEWIEDDEEEEGSYDEKHRNDRVDVGDDEDNNEDETNGGSQEGNRGATSKRSMTGGKEMRSTVSAKRSVFSAPTSPAEEVETTINVAADDLEEMQKSPETFNVKVMSIDPSEGQAVLPTVDNTADNNDTELPPAQDVGDAHVNDVEYSNRAKKQAFMGRVGPVSAPAAIIDSESGEEFSFSKPFSPRSREKLPVLGPLPLTLVLNPEENMYSGLVRILHLLSLQRRPQAPSSRREQPTLRLKRRAIAKVSGKVSLLRLLRISRSISRQLRLQTWRQSQI